MKKQMIWGLGVLILLIGIAGVFLLIPQDIDTEQELVLSEETKKQLEDGSKQHVLVQEADKPSSVLRNGHWHDGEWNEEPHVVTVGTDTIRQMLPELAEAEIKAKVKALRAQQLADYRAKWGEDPSTDGSYQHFRDNHGNVVRHYRGTIVVSDYNLIIGFAPTPSELKHYKKLRIALKDAVLSENVSEMERINEEIQSLVNSAQGEIPDPFGFGYHGNPISGDQEKILHNKALRSFYQRMDVAHLYELYGECSY